MSIAYQRTSRGPVAGRLAGKARWKLAERAAVRDGPPPCSSPAAVPQSWAVIASRTASRKRESAERERLKLQLA